MLAFSCTSVEFDTLGENSSCIRSAGTYTGAPHIVCGLSDRVTSWKESGPLTTLNRNEGFVESPECLGRCDDTWHSVRHPDKERYIRAAPIDIMVNAAPVSISFQASLRFRIRKTTTGTSAIPARKIQIMQCW